MAKAVGPGHLEVKFGFEVVDVGGAGFAIGDDLALSDEPEKKRAGDLLDVVAVTDPRVLEEVGVVPDFGDN